MRTPCKYAHESRYDRYVDGKIREVIVNECWATKEPFECDSKCKETCGVYESANKDKVLKWLNAGYSDEWYGCVCKCARCGAEVCGCDARNYCSNCGYEYKPWDDKIL